MRNRLPNEVPVSGERYNVTVTSAGLNPAKRPVVGFTIDNGKYRGVRVSAPLSGELSAALVAHAGVEPNHALHVEFIEKAYKNDARLSCEIVVERTAKNEAGQFFAVDSNYTDSNVYIHYQLLRFDAASGKSSLKNLFARKAAKFKRPDANDTGDA